MRHPTPPLLALALLAAPLALACTQQEDEAAPGQAEAATADRATPDTADHRARAEAGAVDPSVEPKPAGWQLRLDHPDRGSPDSVYFVDMAPGWHVTTGPATLLYHPDSTASGQYRVEGAFHLFDPGRRREGYGIFVGGQQLQGEQQRYTYFLLRRDGRFLIKTRTGEETTVVRDWSEHPAIVSWEGKPADAATAANTMAIEVGSNEVAFLVNAQEVARVPKSELTGTDGIFGLRVNHALNLHVTSLTSS